MNPNFSVLFGGFYYLYLNLVVLNC